MNDRETLFAYSIQGRAEVDFTVALGVKLSLHHRFSTDKSCETYKLTVKVEGPKGAPDVAVAGDAHAMLRHGVQEAAEALLAALDADEATNV